MDTQNDQAARFRALHVPGTPLLLANAWDATSARIVEAAGAAAIATSSGAVANALGYPDGDALPPAEAIAATRRIAACLRVPLSVDAEGGYSDNPSAVAELVLALLDAGAVGINIEDGAAPPELLAEKIRAVRGAAAARGRDLFINARTDVFLRRLTPADQAHGETLRRLELYRAAGADGGFVPYLTDLEQLAAVTAASPLPINVLFTPSIAPVATLAAAGVARISLGSALCRASLTLVDHAAREFLHAGTYDGLGGASALTHQQVNQLFAPR
ncbi:MAG: isocitrate lyase/phosphoenolpyruvate mutase family protein [Deltaproteobacteria bacterium]|nr:isocitrate lyase/phosphoenolpyruvate mutase family protein [Deltaproteobacteria bacterium]